MSYYAGLSPSFLRAHDDSKPARPSNPTIAIGESLENTPLLASNADDETVYGTTDNPDDPSTNSQSDTKHALASPVHFRDVTRNGFWFSLFGIIFGNLICFFDSTLMASAHPVITSYFHASNSASWLSTVFFLSSTVFPPLLGRISDTVGRRPVYLSAIIIFILTTLWCALATSIESLIMARALAGLGAGGVIAMSFVVMGDIVKVEYRGIYQSYLNIAYGVGNSSGAVLGGLLCDKLGWRWAFGVQIPFLLVYFVVAIFSTPKNIGPQLMRKEGKGVFDALRSFDLLGSVIMALSVTGLILGLNLGGNIFPWTSPIPIVALLTGVLSAILLLPVERRATRPIMPLPFHTTSPQANLIFSGFFGGMTSQISIFNVPLYYQAVRLTSASTSGLFLLSPLVGVTLASVSTGFYVTYSRRLTPTTYIGAILQLLGSAATVLLTPNTPLPLSVLLVGGAMTGQGFIFPTAVIASLALQSREDQAVISTTVQLWRNLGAVMGVAVSSWILQNALVVTLNDKVTGLDKNEIVRAVRSSVEAIGKLDPLHQAEVVDAYSVALRYTFLSGAVFGVVICALILPIRLPRLRGHGD